MKKKSFRVRVKTICCRSYAYRSNTHMRNSGPTAKLCNLVYLFLPRLKPPPFLPWFISFIFMQKERNLMYRRYYTPISSIISGHSQPSSNSSFSGSRCVKSSISPHGLRRQTSSQSQNGQIEPTWGTERSSVCAIGNDQYCLQTLVKSCPICQ